MSQYISLTSSPIQILRENEEKFLAMVKKHLETYHRDESIELIGGGDGTLEYMFDLTADVGDSFSERIEALADELSPLLLEPCYFQIRTESMSDDRDTNIYAAATPEAAAGFQLHMQLTEIQYTLRALQSCNHPAAGPIIDIRSQVDELIAATKTKADLPAVVHSLPFGDIRVRAGQSFILNSSGHMLVAGVLREDGDADVVGSINMDYLAFMPPRNAQAFFNAFMHIHDQADVIAIMESTPDVIQIQSEADTQSAPRSN